MTVSPPRSPRPPLQPWAPPAAFVTEALDAAAIVAATDVRGRITHCNDLFCEISGYSRDELIGTNHRILNSGSHEPGFFTAMYAAITAGQVWKGTICNRRKSGELYWVDTTVVPQRDASGRVAGYLAIRFDVTAHVSALQELAEARAKAELALDVKARIVANMSHELRTPLSGIIGMAQILEATELSDRQRGFLRAIVEASDSLQGLVNEVLKLAQLEAGAMVLAPAPTDPRALVASVVALLGPRAEDKGLELAFTPGRLPALVRLDPLRTRQVLTNLVGNAIKFTDRGGVTVSADWRDGRLICSVEDTGPGFAAAEKDRLFRAFEQGENTLSKSVGGAGLGLAISRELVRAMGGEIDAESWPGLGSRFHFQIAAPRARRQRAVRAEASKTPEAGRTLSVLVVEDNPVIQQVMKHVLEAAACEVTLSGDGADAVAAVRGRPFDLCMMDLRMPGMDGFAATAQIRRLPYGADLPVFAVSADVLDGRRAVEGGQGFDGFLPKPLRPDLLIATVAARRNALASAAADRTDAEARQCA